jgi:hypothetical protein
MNKINFAGPEIAASRRRGITVEGIVNLAARGYARCVGGAAARVGGSFARLLCCPALTERGRKEAP